MKWYFSIFLGACLQSSIGIGFSIIAVPSIIFLFGILFGQNFTEFFGIDIVGNIGELVAKFGNAGLVGIVAAAIVAYLIVRNSRS